MFDGVPNKNCALTRCGGHHSTIIAQTISRFWRLDGKTTEELKKLVQLVVYRT